MIDIVDYALPNTAEPKILQKKIPWHFREVTKLKLLGTSVQFQRVFYALMFPRYIQNHNSIKYGR